MYRKRLAIPPHLPVGRSVARPVGRVGRSGQLIIACVDVDRTIDACDGRADMGRTHGQTHVFGFTDMTD